MKPANLLYVIPPITVSMYRQPLGRCKSRGWMPSVKLQGQFKDWYHERASYREKLSCLAWISVSLQAKVVENQLNPSLATSRRV